MPTQFISHEPSQLVMLSGNSSFQATIIVIIACHLKIPVQLLDTSVHRIACLIPLIRKKNVQYIHSVYNQHGSNAV